MNKVLRMEMIRVLEVMIRKLPEKTHIRELVDDGNDERFRDLLGAALKGLEELGAIRPFITGCISFELSVHCYDRYEQLKAPRQYWLRQNWFPVSVLGVSSFATVFGAVLNALLR